MDALTSFVSIITFSLFLPASSQAQLINPELNAPVPPVIHKANGKPIQAQWPNGRRAELKITRSTPSSATVDFEVTENTCSNTIGHKGEMTFNLSKAYMAWFWVKHTDPQKVGQILKMKNFFGPNPENGADIWMPALTPIPAVLANTLEFKAPLAVARFKFPKDYLEFMSVDWLPKDARGADSFYIRSWTGERMILNPETGVPENLVFGGAFGVELQKSAAGVNRFNIAKVDHWFSFFRNDAMGPMGEVIAWDFETVNGNCLVVVKPNIPRANMQLDEFFNKPPDQPFVAFNWGEDEFPELFFLFDNFSRFATADGQPMEVD